jgi:hypothetical protein
MIQSGLDPLSRLEHKASDKERSRAPATRATSNHIIQQTLQPITSFLPRAIGVMRHRVRHAMDRVANPHRRPMVRHQGDHPHRVRDAYEQFANAPNWLHRSVFDRFISLHTIPPVIRFHYILAFPLLLAGSIASQTF